MESGRVGPTVPSYKESRETAGKSKGRATGDELQESSTSLPIVMAVKTENEENNLEPLLCWTEFSQSQMESKCEVEAASNNPAEVRKLKTEEEECRIHPPDVDSNKFKMIFSCAECCKEFEDQKSLLNHFTENTTKCINNQEKSNVNSENTVQKRNLLIKCSVCGIEFRTKLILRVHMRTHKTERPFSCDECGDRFGRRAHLNQHLRIHTGEKPFSCDECGHRASQKSNLSKHMRVLHARE